MALGKADLQDWDVILGGKGFMLQPGSLIRAPLPMSFTQIHRGPDQDSIYDIFEAALWTGDGIDDWRGDGPFRDGYGLDLGKQGSVKAALIVNSLQADAADTAGYIGFTIGTTAAVLIGKTTGKVWRTTNGTSVSLATTLAAACTSWCTFQGKYFVGLANGDTLYTTDGTTFTASGITKPNSNPAYVLGGFRGKMYVAYNNLLKIWDGTSLTDFNSTANPAASTLDCTNAVAGAVGRGGLWILTQGPSRIFFTDGNQLQQPGEFNTDFVGWDITVTGDFLVWGGTPTASGGYTGEVHSLGANGFQLIKSYGELTETNDRGIRCATQIRGRYYFGYNQGAVKRGLGVYDTDLDIFVDTTSGFYLGSTIPGGSSGTVWGITQFLGKILFGVAGVGVYGQGTTYGNFQIESSLFKDQKHISKMVRFAELRNAVLASGQSLQVDVGVGDGTWTTILTVAAGFYSIEGLVAFQLEQLPNFPVGSLRMRTDFQQSTFQYRLTATSNGALIEVTNLVLRYLQVGTTTKYAWNMTIATEGSESEPMGLASSGSVADRGSVQMVTDLDAMWNTIVDFIDPLSGTTHKVVVVNPRLGVADMDKEVDASGAPVRIAGNYPLRLLQAD